MMLQFIVPMVVVPLITLLTDLYTFCHIKYCKHSSEQLSTYHAEYYYLKDICKICHKHCNDKSIVTQKVDIPLKCTAIYCVILALLVPIFITSILTEYVLLFIYFFFTAVNILMIVCLSTRNNFANIAAARQRNATLAWNRTCNQQWERRCFLEERIQNTVRAPL